MKKAIALFALALVPTLAFAGASVSAMKKPNRGEGANQYGGPSAIDGKMDTAWMVPGDSPNLGESIKLEIPTGKLDKIGIVNGWTKSEETFTDHPRIKRMKVEFICCTDTMGDVKTTFTTHIDLEDTPEMQIIDIENAAVGNEMFGGWLKLSIVELYEGKDFPNAGISELMIYMEEFDAIATIEGSSDEDPEHITMDMQDDSNKTYFATPSEGAYIEFGSDAGLGLSSVHLVHGPNTHDRVKKVKMTANNRSIEVEVPDGKGAHQVMIPAIMGYTGSAWGSVKMEVLEVYEGTSAKGTLAIAEFDAKATNNPGF